MKTVIRRLVDQLINISRLLAANPELLLGGMVALWLLGRGLPWLVAAGDRLIPQLFIVH